MPDEAPVTSATGFLSFIELPSKRWSVIIVHSPYDEHHIVRQKKNTGYDRCGSPLGAGWVQVLQRRFAQGLGELGVIDRAGQHQSADHRGHCHERAFVGTRRSLVGRMPCDDIDHFLDATGRGSRSEEHTSELQSQSNLVCRLLLEKKKNNDTASLDSHLTSAISRIVVLITYSHTILIVQTITTCSSNLLLLSL